MSCTRASAWWQVSRGARYSRLGLSPQMAALNTVMQNSRNVTMCTPVQYSQMSPIW